jgi:hypothetical protein
LILLALASRRNKALISNNFRIQSQISSVDAGLRYGSIMAGFSASLPSNPSICKLALFCGAGVNKTSISLIYPESFSDALTSP